MKKVVISIGNPLRSDDNIGNIVLEKLKKKVNDIKFIKATTSPENYIEPLKKINPKIIFFIDVAKFEGNIGDVKIFKLEDIMDIHISTHYLPISVFKDYFPDSKIFLIGIKPKTIDFGEELTPELKKNLPQIIKKIEKIVESI
jgi:hydrogenase 3 maturation protease